MQSMTSMLEVRPSQKVLSFSRTSTSSEHEAPMTVRGEAQTCEWQSCLERCGMWAVVAREVCEFGVRALCGIQSASDPQAQR